MPLGADYGEPKGIITNEVWAPPATRPNSAATPPSLKERIHAEKSANDGRTVVVFAIDPLLAAPDVVIASAVTIKGGTADESALNCSWVKAP